MIKNYKIEEIKELTNKKKISYKIDKELYGEVLTPFFFIEKMFNIFPNELFKNPNLKWLDPCCGIGNFFIVVYMKLMETLEKQFPNREKRHSHIIENMLYHAHNNILYQIFTFYSHIYNNVFAGNQSRSI